VRQTKIDRDAVDPSGCPSLFSDTSVIFLYVRTILNENRYEKNVAFSSHTHTHTHTQKHLA
jgi:hypothetical protein